MIKVMVVEDEAPIQRSIKSAIESSKFEVIATAFNGLEALQLLNTIKPDVIITDIRMPVMDGLELTEKVRELYPNIQIILLSGHQEFDYARQAMQLGVTDYLLKPVSRQQIKGLLDAVCSATIKKRRELHQLYAASLIHGKSQLGIPFMQLEIYKSHIFLLCCAGPIPTFSFDDDIPGKTYWEQSSLESILQDIMEDAGDFAIVNGKSVSEQAVILSFYRESESEHAPREWAQTIADRLGGTLPVSVVYSDVYSDLQETTSLAQTGRSMLYKNMVFGEPILLSMSDRTERSFYEPENDPILDRKLAAAVEQKNISLLMMEIETLLEKWHHLRLRQMILEKKMTRILEVLYHEMGSFSNYTGEMLEIDVNQMILQSSDYEGIFRYTCGIVEFLFSLQNSDAGESGNEQMAIRVEKYLREHYAEPINHQMLSDKFGLVPSYLSKIFTKYKGTSPAKYVIQLRIEKAKELLLEPSGRLAKDIAEIVGYQDPNYFSRIFKRETGLYPSEFREQAGNTV